MWAINLPLKCLFLKWMYVILKYWASNSYNLGNFSSSTKTLSLKTYCKGFFLTNSIVWNRGMSPDNTHRCKQRQPLTTFWNDHRTKSITQQKLEGRHSLNSAWHIMAPVISYKTCSCSRVHFRRTAVCSLTHKDIAIF